MGMGVAKQVQKERLDLIIHDHNHLDFQNMADNLQIDDDVIFVSYQPSVVTIDLSTPAPPSATVRQNAATSNRLETCKRCENFGSMLENRFKITCAICLGPPKRPHSTTCGHIFCSECITAAIKHSNSKCPTCKKYLTVNSTHPIYF